MSGQFGSNGGGASSVTTTSGIQGTGTAADPIKENFDALPVLNGVLDTAARIVMCDDPANPNGQRVKVESLAQSMVSLGFVAGAGGGAATNNILVYANSYVAGAAFPNYLNPPKIGVYDAKELVNHSFTFKSDSSAPCAKQGNQNLDYLNLNDFTLSNTNDNEVCLVEVFYTLFANNQTNLQGLLFDVGIINWNSTAPGAQSNNGLCHNRPIMNFIQSGLHSLQMEASFLLFGSSNPNYPVFQIGAVVRNLNIPNQDIDVSKSVINMVKITKLA